MKTVKKYSFDNIKNGERITDRVNIRIIGEIIVNPKFVTIIEPCLEAIGVNLFYVRICKQSVIGQHDFYTDYEGMKEISA